MNISRESTPDSISTTDATMDFMEETKEERIQRKEKTRRDSEDLTQKRFDSDIKFLKKFSGLSKKVDYSDRNLTINRSTLADDDWIFVGSFVDEPVIENIDVINHD